MNEPHLTSEEQINKEKYEEAKHHFDELYRDILATEDLKNHPELIEELNRISSSSSNSNLECRNGPSMSIPHDTMSKSEASTSIAPPPVSNDDNDHYAPKEDTYNNFEDIDRKLNNFAFDDHQTTTLPKQYHDQNQTLNMNQNLNSNLNNLDDNSPVKKQVSNSHLNEYNYDNMEGSHPSLNRKNYN
jgi:hypothetical protein